MDLNPPTLAAAADRLRAARRLVVFTGAGVSAESGIPTFRDGSGLWERFPLEQFAHWGGLLSIARKQPERLAEFLHAVIEPIAVARPNAGHRAIAQLERHVPTTVITQNVDGLHQEAGSTQVREVHGSFFRITTLRGELVRTVTRAELVQTARNLERLRRGPFKLPRLLLALRSLVGPGWRGLHRPGVVLFGEDLAEPDWSDAERDVENCDVVLVVGTSGLVYPAAGLPSLAREQGACIIGVDPEEAGESDIWLRGRAGEVFPQLVAAAFSR
jgi:NAD-dependent deacetylase